MWAFNVFKEWLKFYASGESEEPVVEYVEADLFSEDAEKVCAIMCKFVLEARQQNGNHYSPKTLLQLSTNLQSWALAQNPNACRFMDARDPSFHPFHNVLNNTSKKLLASGVGSVKKQAKVITPDEEDILWSKGVIGTHTPTSLLNAVFFYCGVYFCLRGGNEHRQLKLSQFEFKEVTNPTDSAKMVKCVIYTEHGSKIVRESFIRYIWTTRWSPIMPIPLLVKDVLFT